MRRCMRLQPAVVSSQSTIESEACMACIICGGNQFDDYRNRKGEKCRKCGAKARHRVAMKVYEMHLLPLVENGVGRVLHLAPEVFLYPKLFEMFGSGYMTADATPDRYPHAECLKLFFPQDFGLFPDDYFDAILHNHVLEHIPGHYGDHLLAFARLLKPGGKMIFSVPGPYMDLKSREGGELLETDAQRLEQFLQEDHYKLLGSDFVEFIRSMPNGSLLEDGINDEIRAELNVRPGKAPFFVWQKQLST